MGKRAIIIEIDEEDNCKITFSDNITDEDIIRICYNIINDVENGKR